MPGVNKCMFVGNSGDNAVLRYTPGGTSVANFNIAINEKWKDKGGQAKERTTWVKCVAWGKLAEVVGQYVTKGKTVYVEGRLQNREYQDKEGVTRWSTEIQVETLQLLGGGGDIPRAVAEPDMGIGSWPS